MDMANSEAAKRLRKAESDGTAKVDAIPSWRRRLDARIREHTRCLPGLLVARRPDATDTSDWRGNGGRVISPGGGISWRVAVDIPTDLRYSIELLC